MMIKSLVLLIATSLMLLGCGHVAANYPAKAVAASAVVQEVPTHVDGRNAVYVDDRVSVFYNQWADPISAREKFIALTMDGDQKAKEAISNKGRHSLKSVIDEELAFVITYVFFGEQGSMSFSEGTYLIHFEDGSSALDHGVVVNMDPRDTTTYRNVKRSYKGMPLRVTSLQIPTGKSTAKIDFLLPRSHMNKKVVGIEYVGTADTYSLQEK